MVNIPALYIHVMFFTNIRQHCAQNSLNKDSLFACDGAVLCIINVPALYSCDVVYQKETLHLNAFVWSTKSTILGGFGCNFEKHNHFPKLG